MKKPILTDHKKHGKKLITPLNSIANINSLSFFDEVVPEIFWIDLVIKKFQLRHTYEILDKIAFSIKAFDLNDFFCPGLLSHYYKLSDNQKELLTNNPNLISLRQELSEALVGFIDYFPNCPINFLLNTCSCDKNAFIKNLKLSLQSLVNSKTKESALVLTTLFSVSQIFVTSKLKDSYGDIDLNDILLYPVTDASQRVASFVRASVNPMIAITLPTEVRKKWEQSFWQACQQMEPLNLTTLEDCEV